MGRTLEEDDNREEEGVEVLHFFRCFFCALGVVLESVLRRGCFNIRCGKSMTVVRIGVSPERRDVLRTFSGKSGDLNERRKDSRQEEKTKGKILHGPVDLIIFLGTGGIISQPPPPKQYDFVS